MSEFIEEVERKPDGEVSAFIFTGWDGQPFKLYAATLPAGPALVIQPVIRDKVLAELELEINDGSLYLDAARAEWLQKQFASFLASGKLTEG